MASLTTAADKSRSIEIPSSQVARFCEASLPQSAPVHTCVRFLCRETALCGRLELDRPSFANEPLIKRCGLAFDRTNPEPPVLESDQPGVCGTATRLPWVPRTQNDAPPWSACETSGQSRRAAAVTAPPVFRIFDSTGPIANLCAYLQSAAARAVVRSARL